MAARGEITRIQQAVEHHKRTGTPLDLVQLLDDLVEALLKMDSAIDNAHVAIKKLKKP